VITPGCIGCEVIGQGIGGCPVHDREGGHAYPGEPQPLLDTLRLARAIHASNDHPNVPGCLDMDRDTAELLARAYEAGS
jgi:hypothetical protein